MTSYRDGHQSGRFDATYLQRLAMNRQIAVRCSICVITEYAGLEFLVPGWGETGVETKIVFDEKRWRLRRHGAVHTPTVQWKRGTDLRRGVNITWGLFEHRTKSIRLLRGGGHLPAHFDEAGQEEANLQALQGLEKGFQGIIHDERPDEVTFSLDFNRVLTLDRNKKLINESVSGLGMKLIVPPGITHRPNHKIEGFVTTAAHSKQQMFNWRMGYDHRGIERESFPHAA